MYCPHCHKVINIGSIIGSVKSERKSEAAKMNGKKGGRPKKSDFLRVVREKSKEIGEAMVKKTEEMVVEINKGPMFFRCQSPGCPSLKTNEYQRATGRFWLCETHKP